MSGRRDDPVTRVARLPAAACAHFVLGRCRYEENVNPGLYPKFRCQALVRLESAYDAFLTQADAFALDETLAASLWNARCQRLCQESGCQDYEPGDNSAYPGCLLFADGVCLKRLPECPGRCPRYTLNTQGDLCR